MEASGVPDRCCLSSYECYPEAMDMGIKTSKTGALETPTDQAIRLEHSIRLATSPPLGPCGTLIKGWFIGGLITACS